MTQKKKGTISSETVIWYVVASLLIGFLSGVAFGIYKSRSLFGTAKPAASAQVDAQWQESVDLLKKRIEKNPEDTQSLIQLGHLYFDGGKVTDAIDAYEKALVLAPNNADVWTDLGVMYRRDGNPEKAVEAFERAMGLDPKHEHSRFNKGIVLLHDLKDAKGAIASWESLLVINPNAVGPGGQTVKALVEHTKQAHMNPS